VALERAQQRRVGFLTPSAATPIPEHSPSASLSSACNFSEEARLADAGLTSQQQQRWSFAGEVAIEQEELACATDELRSRGRAGPRPPRAMMGERSMIQGTACRFEALALMRRKVQCLCQEGNRISPRCTTHAALDVRDGAGAEMGALSEFLLSQSSGTAMTPDQGPNSCRRWLHDACLFVAVGMERDGTGAARFTMPQCSIALTDRCIRRSTLGGAHSPRIDRVQ